MFEKFSRKIRFHYKITFLYFTVGFIWIFFSDTILGSLFPDSEILTKINIFKGSFYVLTTSLLLFYFVRRHNEKLQKVQRLLKERNEELAMQNEEYKQLNEELQHSKQLTEKANRELNTKNEELNNRNLFIRTILNNLPIGLALNRFDEGVATYMNKQFVAIYGWPKEELIDITSFFEKVYPDATYRNQIVKRITTDIETGDPTKMRWENIEITQKNGSKRIINAVNIPLIKQNTMVSTVMDITQLKITEQKLRHAKEKAEESNRLKTAFLNNISHEFRTPMNGILGFATLIALPDKTEQQREKFAQMIKESTDQLLNIVNDTIEMSQIQSGQAVVREQLINVDEMLEIIVAEFRQKAEYKDLPVKIETATPGSVLTSDEYKLSRVLRHLLDNAVKFTYEGEVVVAVRYAAGRLVISVSDTGIGIAPTDQQYLFTPYRQVETGATRSYGGNGLGLALSKAYTELLGGRIHLQSEQGRGTTVTVEIPDRKPATPTESFATSAPAQTTPVVWKDKSILVVEDEEINLWLIQEILQETHARVLCAQNGQEAVELCRKKPDIDLIIMDIKMPVMDGYEAIKQIRQLQSKHIPVIAQTAYAMEHDRDEIQNKGFDGFLPKPVKHKQLLDTVAAHLKRKTALPDEI